MRPLILPGSLLLLCLAGATPLLAQQITWSIQQVHTGGNDASSPVTITYTVSDDTTRIDSPAETVFIEYQAHRLFRLRNPDRSCIVFPFAAPHASLPIARVRLLASEVRRRTVGPSGVRKQLLFGADQALSLMMAPPLLQRYGQNFTITTVSYSLSDSLTVPEFLFDVARRHRRIFSDYPLLRQIDPIGVLELLQGFPWQSEQLLPHNRVLSTLVDGPHPVTKAAGKPDGLQPPQACLDLPPEPP